MLAGGYHAARKRSAKKAPKPAESLWAGRAEGHFWGTVTGGLLVWPWLLD